MNIEYEIKCLADFASLPADKLDACLRDFSYWVDLIRAANELPDGLSILRDGFRWIDDGIDGISGVDIYTDGEKITSVEFR